MVSDYVYLALCEILVIADVVDETGSVESRCGAVVAGASQPLPPLSPGRASIDVP